MELTEDGFHKFSVESRDIEDGLKEYTYTLTIPSGRHKDTGQYKFTAKNKYGQDECSVSSVKDHFHHVNISRVCQHWSICQFMSSV